MRISFLKILALSFIHPALCTAQNEIDSLRFWGDAMISLSSPELREYAATEFNKNLRRKIRGIEDSSRMRFHPSVIRIDAPDNSFVLYTWQREAQAGNYRYGFCMLREGQDPVIGQSAPRNYRKVNYERFDKNNWYGAIYYKLLPDTFNGNYILLGYSQSSDGTRHRIIEVLGFEGGNIFFGAPVFAKANQGGPLEKYYRAILHYSPGAQPVITYDPSLKQIVYDHISSFSDPRTGEVILAQDGTFEAYDWSGNLWVHNPYLQGHPLDQAPIEKPVLDKDRPKRDLFGRPQKN
ncbi:MAG: hypothetical protein JPMHGGIA_00200 [Saprospiraceae bacterium]|jgi:hypothetical protein|nr:hypothetical protein [Saprospiraceae bacterium]